MNKGVITMEAMIAKELERFPRKEVRVFIPVEGGDLLGVKFTDCVMVQTKMGAHTYDGRLEVTLSAEEQEIVYNTIKAMPTPTHDEGSPADEVYEGSHKTEVFVGDETDALCELLIFEKEGRVVHMHDSHYGGRSILSGYKSGDIIDMVKTVDELRAVARAIATQADELENETKNPSA